MSSPPDMYVPYAEVMADRKIDREAWASEVAWLIREEAGGNKSAFARMVGLKSAKTVDRWLAGTVEVSQANVLAVCRALKIPPLGMLIKVGLMDPSEITQAMRDEAFRLPMPSDGGSVTTVYRSLRHPAVEDAQAIATINAADIPPHLKRELLEHLRAQQVEHERQRLTEIERMISIAQRNEPRVS